MLKTLIKGLKELSRRDRGVDPSRFDDPVADKTAWGPLKSGGASFCTRHLVEVGPHRLEFRATLGAQLFYLIFAVMGLATVIIFPFGMASSGEGGVVILFPILIGLVFVAVGGGMYYFGTMPVVFDRGTGHYWRGRTPPDLMPDRNAATNWVDLKDIHALQLLSEWCRSSSSNGGGSSYYSYELNLVLRSGDRINVVDHGKIRRLRTDAERLSRFLDVPIWDAT